MSASAEGRGSKEMKSSGYINMLNEHTVYISHRYTLRGIICDVITDVREKISIDSKDIQKV